MQTTGPNEGPRSPGSPSVNAGPDQFLEAATTVTLSGTVNDPSGNAVYRGDVTEQIIPIEIDLELVRRSRERGMRGLGQMMKSFRDRPVDFPVYDRARFDRSYLDSLGPVATPRRADAPPPTNVHTLPPRRSFIN